MKRLLVLLCLAACGAPKPKEDALPFAEASAEAAPAPAEFGPYPVGVRTLEILDTGRKKPDGTPRKLVVEVWYPATQATRGQPGVSYEIRSVFTAEQQAKLSGVNVPVLQTTAVRDAEVAKHGPFPLVMFSHGQAAIRWQSTYLTVKLASHGYVVASPDHEGGTLYDAVRNQLAGTTELLDNRPLDISYVVSRLGRLPSEDPLAGKMDLEKLGVCGHSFGALTSLRVASTDKRVKAIVPQAPVDANLALLGVSKELTIPVQVQAAHDDQTLEWDSNVKPTMEVLKRPKYLLDVIKGGHFTFSDLCGFDLATLAGQIDLGVQGTDLKKVLADGCGPQNPPAAVAQPLLAHFAIGFFNATLKGSQGSWALLTQAKADEFQAGVATWTPEP